MDVREEHVMTYATGNLKTVVTSLAAERFRWRQSPSPGSRTTLLLPDLAVRQAVTDAGTDNVSLVFPMAIDGDFVYEVPNSVSIVWTMLTGITRPPDHVGLIHEVGQIANRLHTMPPPPGTMTHAPWLKRLQQWLNEPSGKDSERFLFSILGEHITRDRWDDLGQWCTELLDSPQSRVLLLGSLLPGEIIAGKQAGSGCVLAAGSVASGHQASDIATLLEGLVTVTEMASRAPNLLIEAPDFASLAQAFLVGYGPMEDDRIVAQTAVLRRLSRLVDVAAHLGWNDYLSDQAAAMARHIDSEGSSLLEPCEWRR
ncbi:hypothetical protein F0L68_33625 [Solihabitans fulvus]|uniref:Uncharacterized protein n=1 Tax=Solihabitans fulvus TaxID=1892852 RepID=A0A5B2WR00_9PSEU|nr:hypothetical protein [Solihabitans fulvus]KAA2253092.1 hypothetical protein F0L68_33625 [Solihabitans fulvus]